MNAQTTRTAVARPSPMNAVSRELFISAAAADAVTPTYLRATVADFQPHVLHQNVHGRTIHVMTRCSSRSKEVHRVPLSLHTRRSTHSARRADDDAGSIQSALCFGRCKMRGPRIFYFLHGSDPIAQLGSNALAPAVTAALDLVGRQALFPLTGSCSLVLL